MSICKTSDFKYVTYSRTQFVKPCIAMILCNVEMNLKDYIFFCRAAKVKKEKQVTHTQNDNNVNDINGCN